MDTLQVNGVEGQQVLLMQQPALFFATMQQPALFFCDYAATCSRTTHFANYRKKADAS
jgi:hypothetical protein